MAGASAKVIPYGFHGMDMESIWINPGRVKTSKNAPQRTQKHETVSGHLRNSDYEVSHVVDTCLRVPPTLPNSALAPPSHPAPSAGQPPYPLTQGTLLL